MGAETVMAATPVVMGVGSALLDRKTGPSAIKNNRDENTRAEDLDVRREATYRANRGTLQSAIADFYKQKGWAMPTPAEGAYTSRALPGETQIYSETTLPEANWYYGADPIEIPPVAASDGPDPIIDPNFNAPSTQAQSVPLSYATPAPMSAPVMEDSESYKKLLRSYGY